MSPSPPKQSQQSQPWWLDLLRREGLATALVMIWIVCIAIPESQERRVVLREIQTAVSRIVECESTQAAAVQSMHQFSEDSRRSHTDLAQAFDRLAAKIQIADANP